MKLAAHTVVLSWGQFEHLFPLPYIFQYLEAFGVQLGERWYRTQVEAKGRDGAKHPHDSPYHRALPAPGVINAEVKACAG